MASTCASLAFGLMPPSWSGGIQSVTGSVSESLVPWEAIIPKSIAPKVLVTEYTWYFSVEPPGQPPSQQSLPWRITTNGVCTNLTAAASSTSGSMPHSATIRSRGTCCQSAVPGSCAPAVAGNAPAPSATIAIVNERLMVFPHLDMLDPPRCRISSRPPSVRAQKRQDLGWIFVAFASDAHWLGSDDPAKKKNQIS